MTRVFEDFSGGFVICEVRASVLGAAARSDVRELTALRDVSRGLSAGSRLGGCGAFVELTDATETSGATWFAKSWEKLETAGRWFREFSFDRSPPILRCGGREINTTAPRQQTLAAEKIVNALRIIVICLK
jgi:hypothetical protein